MNIKWQKRKWRMIRARNWRWTFQMNLGFKYWNHRVYSPSVQQGALSFYYPIRMTGEHIFCHTNNFRHWYWLLIALSFILKLITLNFSVHCLWVKQNHLHNSAMMLFSKMSFNVMSKMLLLINVSLYCIYILIIYYPNFACISRNAWMASRALMDASFIDWQLEGNVILVSRVMFSLIRLFGQKGVSELDSTVVNQVIVEEIWVLMPYTDAFKDKTNWKS